jgi:hypothetical protein
MCATYKDKQKRSHFESFANKIYTGIREIKPEYAQKRAIWELFQNALDTVKDNGIIKIVKTEKGLLFEHNGRPFKDDEFGGLIKQFSVGKTYGDNNVKLGQYGTGFISTHVYGKKIIVNGSIQTDDGTYRILNDFELDREAIDLDTLTDKLLTQDEIIEHLCDNNLLSELTPLPFTKFEYVASDINKTNIDVMLDYINGILPYIFCFNEKLSKVTLLQDTIEIIYERIGTSNGVVNITKNNEPIAIPFISDPENNVKVIIGTKDRSLLDIPKQFLFYPLMETSEIGYNFIIHANNFKPNRERDYLHNDKGNEELKTDVETNERLLKIAFESVLLNLKTNEDLELLDVANIEFTKHDSNFEQQLKKELINEIKSLERLCYDGINYSLNILEYFDYSILNLDEKTRKSLYLLFKEFRSLPPFEIFCDLSKYINNWNSHIEDKFDTVSLSSLAEIISNESRGNYFFIKDKTSYQTFISEIALDISLLNRLALIPNIHGDFKCFENLVKWQSKEANLINVIDNINASNSEKYIHEDFEFLENVTIYNREKFKDDFSKFCNEYVDDFLKGKLVVEANSIKYRYLIQYLNDFIALNKKTQLNIEISSFYQRVFNLNQQTFDLVDPSVDVNYQPAIKLLANLYFKNIVTSEIELKILDLKEIVSIMYKNKNLREELLHKLECYPNQNYILKSQTELKRDDVKDVDFKDEYDKITGDIIREELAFEGFEEFLQHSGYVNGSYLGDAIETKLNSDKRFIPVDVSKVDQIIKLIEHISSKPTTWGQWLRNINDVKEEILMHKFKDEKTRTSLFSILTKSPKTIELLGDLAKLSDLEDLIRKGKEKQKEENRSNNHLQYINKIGLQIQNIIEKQLGKDLAETIKVENSNENSQIITKEEQNGQDFIIYKDLKPLHYIEVKSKWDENGRFALSKNQTEKCAKEKANYSVITVNVERYKKEKKHNTEDVSFEELKDYVRVNDGLGVFFEKLVCQNIALDESKNPKLIEYRGSIPQKTIDDHGFAFEKFIENLIKVINIQVREVELKTS